LTLSVIGRETRVAGLSSFIPLFEPAIILMHHNILYGPVRCHFAFAVEENRSDQIPDGPCPQTLDESYNRRDRRCLPILVFSMGFATSGASVKSLDKSGF